MGAPVPLIVGESIVLTSASKGELLGCCSKPFAIRGWLFVLESDRAQTQAILFAYARLSEFVDRRRAR